MQVGLEGVHRAAAVPVRERGHVRRRAAGRIDANEGRADLAVGGERRVDPLGDDGAERLRVDPEVGELVQAERHHALRGQHDDQSRRALDDRRASLVVVVDAAVPDLRLVEAAVEHVEHPSFDPKGLAVQAVGLAADPE